MTIYKLEQDPTIFITPTYYGNKFVYRMAYVRESNYRTLIRNIDLRKDKLRVHGTEIKENMLQRLHDSLTLGQKQGDIYVNCDGACYFLLAGKAGMCKPIHNVVFDWSPFGVVVPNSVNKSLRNELKEKDNEIVNLNRQLLSTMSSLEEAKYHSKELQEQMLAHAKAQKDKDLELNRVIGKLTVVDFELESNKIELDLSKKAVSGLQVQLSSVISELKSTNIELGSSKKSVKELENQLSSSMKANEDFVIQLKNLQEEISSINTELKSTKLLLDLSKQEVQELKNLSYPWKEEHHDMGNKIQDLSNNLNSINSEVRSSNQKLEQVLISMLWNDLVLNHQPNLIQPSLMGVGPLESVREVRCLLNSEDHEAANLGYMLPNSSQISDTTNNLPVLINVEDIDENVLSVSKLVSDIV